MVKLFILGVTGYVGGDALYAIRQAHPEYEITAIVRNSEKGALVAAQYPKVRLVYGDNDSVELIEDETKKADIVLHFAASSDDVPGTTAICKGLHNHGSSTPAYYIHPSGTGILTYEDVEHQRYGEASSKVFDDWEGITEVTSLPDHAFHRDVDKIVLAAGSSQPDKVKTAIVCPPCIYGPGRGPGNQVSMQTPGLARATLETGHGVQVGQGKTLWCEVHVQDLSDLYVKLVEAAGIGLERGESKATWGKQGYYFCEAGDMVWGEVSRWVAASACKKGLIKDDKVVSVSTGEANRLEVGGALKWGANSRSRAYRARELLGWKPTQASLRETIDGTVEVEAKKLGLVPGHAKVAAGDA